MGNSLTTPYLTRYLTALATIVPSLSTVPSITPVPKFLWDISLINHVIFQPTEGDIGPSITLSYNITKRPYNIEIFAEDCQSQQHVFELGDSHVHNTEGYFDIINVTLDVNMTTFATHSYKACCLKMSLYPTEEKEEAVNFYETILNITADLTADVALKLINCNNLLCVES
mmetsp:Transcript_64631/g.76518  ORF Transcript_64631/g.76518 Transcript_64631/m.76518 type:complete len:171 (-) Transcript_64631:12-524(-)